MLKLKIINSINIFSVFLLFVVFFYFYAYLPVEVTFHLNDQMPNVSKGVFFYCSMSIFIVTNLSIRYSIKNYFKTKNIDTFSLWFRLIISFINFFFVSLIVFIGLLNIADSVLISNYQYVLNLGVFALFFWAVVLLILLILKHVGRKIFV